MTSYCSMIHGGLHLDFRDDTLQSQSCCLRKDLALADVNNIWLDPRLIKLREVNKQNQWESGCSNCELIERAGHGSFRHGMNDLLKPSGGTDLSGPTQLDLMFDLSCNLACRTCGPMASTYWQKHLQDNDLWTGKISRPRSKQDVIDAISKLDLSNLQMVVFCGGETLLGQEYWAVTEWLADNVPNAKEQLTVCFQTNGTQPINPRHYDTINRFKLIKLHVSLDGVGKRFEYLRWPANWNQVVYNLEKIRLTAPSNVMFLIEETISIFNLAYINELDDWVKTVFPTNREGDIVNHGRHLANGEHSLAHLTQEYVDAMFHTPPGELIPKDWVENPKEITNMIANIRQFDQFRSQDFVQVFPEVAEYYRRYL